LIDYTMQIYKNIENKNLKYKRYNKYKTFSNFESKKLSNIDKKCIALFLAGFICNDSIHKVFELNSDMTEKRLRKYLKLSKKGTIFSYILSEEFETYYDNEFILFFSKIIRNILNNDKNISAISAENIFCSLKDPDVCGSNIIEHVFKYFKLDSRESYKFEHEIFDEIEEIAIQNQKQKNEGKIEKNNELSSQEDNDYDFEEYNEIKKFGIDLNKIKYATNPAIGREKEIEEMMASLLIDNSVILTGDSAVGKTAIVEGLVYKIQNGNVPEQLKKLRIIKINTSSIISGTKYRGTFEEKLEKIIKCLEKNKNLILFIDEIHTTIGAGANPTEGLDFANLLKPYLDRGQIKIIGTTTTYEYEKYISNDSAFKRRFERIQVNELNDKIIKEILNDIIYKMELTTNVKFNLPQKNLILDTIIELTQNKYRIYNDRINNPDLCIKILKKAFAYAMLENNNEIKINNIEKAIRNYDRIYDSVKERYIEKINVNNKKVDSTPKIIEFKKNSR